MNRTRVTLGVVALVAIFAITAATASAKFVAATGTGGISQAKSGTLAELTIGSGTIVSSKTPDTWIIQELTKQAVTKEGDHLDQNIEFQEPVLTAAPGAPVKINNPVAIQVTQSGEALISKAVKVVITLGEGKACEIELAPASNKALTKVKYANVGTTELEVIGEVGGITNTASAECAAVGVTAGKAGKFKADSIEHGVKLV
jgi:hypothetical protein